MVVIEQEPELELEVTENKGKKKLDHFEASASAEHDAASDGFETASDRGLDSDEDDENISDGGDDPQQCGGEALPEKHPPSENAPLTAEPTTANPPNDASIQDALEKSNESKLEGNALFVAGQYEDALSKYELALQLVPEVPVSAELRSICYANRGICFLKLGKYDETTRECTKALELNPKYVKALLRRAEAHEKRENFEEAITDMKKILEIDPSNDQARKTIFRLEPIAAEKREKMKEEMIGKLKEMGNSLLGRFGMSIDNFKAVKDPNTGSYSISFQQ
ncbi:hypothetical protein SAY86_026949 [Trapa natans]|uniref:Tetratricopeptide repeat protein 1 n=1 Tax=Trapa natans TaxID=22666 RepID=A0AAN7QIJ8_TRANT|nr:hypothetical protein SAY86_026949 [Trapa natans]